MARFFESIQTAVRQFVVSIGHRGIVEVSANYSRIGTFLYMAEHFGYLSGPFDPGIAELGMDTDYFFRHIFRIFSFFPYLFDQCHGGDCVRFQMVVVESERVIFYHDVRKQGEVGAGLESQYASICYRVFAEDDVSAPFAVGVLYQVICPVAVTRKNTFCLTDAVQIGFLKADDVCVCTAKMSGNAVYGGGSGQSAGRQAEFAHIVSFYFYGV